MAKIQNFSINELKKLNASIECDTCLNREYEFKLRVTYQIPTTWPMVKQYSEIFTRECGDPGFGIGCLIHWDTAQVLDHLIHVLDVNIETPIEQALATIELIEFTVIG